MKRTGYILLVLLLMLTLGLGQPAFAQVDPEESQEQQENQQQQENQGILETEAGQTRISEDMNAYRSSNILGSAVQNNQGEKIGNIDEMILDVENREIVFAVMSSGGFLGIADKLYAIPWDELEPKPELGIFVLNVSKQQMEQTSGLSEGNWPGIGNRQWGEGGQQTQGPYEQGYSQGLDEQNQQDQEDQEAQHVEIEQNAFNPAEIEVQTGTTINWNNLDNVPHTVTSGASGADDAGELFDSETLEQQQEYSLTFDESGEYPYFCRFHPEMEGMIVVSEEN